MSESEPLTHKPSLPPLGAALEDDESSWEEKDWRTPKRGTVIADRYRVIRLLGEGGMGVVVETEHLELGIRVAVKLLDPVFSHDPEYTERFKREARTASRLGHQNVVKVMDLGVAEDGRLYYAMELVEGDHLGDIIEREGALEPERAARIMLQVCDALGAAHERNVIHRDLKPENILIAKHPDGSDFVRLTDFGIALQLGKGGDRLTKTGRVLGTPHYMAPEQVARRPVDARTDVYSAGMVLYELLTGTPPFHEGEPVEIMTDQLRSVPESPRRRAPERNIPGFLEGVVMRALEKKPENRHQSVEAFAVELWAALVVMSPHHALGRPPGAARPREDRPSVTTVTTASSTVAQWLRRRTRRGGLIWGLVAAALFCGTAVGVVLGSRQLASTIAVDPPARSEAAQPMGPAVAVVGTTVVADVSAMASSDGGGPEIADTGDLALLLEPVPVAVDTGPPAAPARSGPSTAKLLADATALLGRGNAAAAAPLYRLAVRRSPGSAPAHAGLGQAEFQLGDNAAAARHFERAVQLRPSSIRYRILYGGVLVRLGRQGAARSQYEAVLRSDPENAVARRMLERLE